MRRAFATLIASATLALVTSCVPPPPAPPPPPGSTPAPPPPAPPPPPPAASDWRDWPLTAGTWRYVRTQAGSQAGFGTPERRRLTLTCDRAARRVSLASDTQGPMTIRTSTAVRTIAADLPTTDPLLDAIAFSRGRFVIEQAGVAPLVIPTYAEIGRVIEDCR